MPVDIAPAWNPLLKLCDRLSEPSGLVPAPEMPGGIPGALVPPTPVEGAVKPDWPEEIPVEMLGVPVRVGEAVTGPGVGVEGLWFEPRPGAGLGPVPASAAIAGLVAGKP